MSDHLRSPLLVSIVVAAWMFAPAGTVAASAPAKSAQTPTVTGPVTGGKGTPTVLTTTFDLAKVGYVGEEYFLSGSATAYNATTALTPDGKWTVSPSSTAPYKTRIVVYRPSNAKKFNGTVVVEWLNVSAGFDVGPDWVSSHRELIRDGFAWVGVSAQSVGVQGGSGTVAGVAPGGLKAADPERYGSLSHPGDSFSYDMFTQVGRAVRASAKPSPLGGLKVKRVIAVGESQSAFRMVTYIDGVHPLVHAYDGFLVHSRGGGAANLSQAPLPVVSVPNGTVIRSDVDVPVLTFETETDLTMLGYFPSRQSDTKRFRLWEVAGTAHADAYLTGQGFGDTGDGQAEIKLLDVASASGGPLGCAQPINAGPQYAVLSAAMYHLNRWVRDGTPPPRAPRLDVAAGPPVTINRDEHGNALGGIRTPLVDMPTAALRGDGNAGGTFCALFGRTVAFDASTLASLYPAHSAYVDKFHQAMGRAVKAGFVLRAEAKTLEAAAAQSSIGKQA
jgi:hypothetical protein